MKAIVNLTSFILLMFCCSLALAHGGGGAEREEKPKKPEATQVRRAPHQPEALEHNQLEKLMAEKEIAGDVTAIRCSLNEFTSCRGVEIVLHDWAGKQIAKAHTGMMGIVGFEGLHPNASYIARIESDRYKGEAQVRAGGIYGIKGEKKPNNL